ncbi:4,5-DOPA dioxygenase extradiol [Verticiella sediminum]
MPAIFLGHGSPMNAIEDNRFSRAWRALGEALPRPGGIVVVSAHWLTRGSAVTAALRPSTIHDFGGFPKALFDVDYPAPGSAALAQAVVRVLQPRAVELDQGWGLDHGAWSVLRHLYPAADVPVVQLSLDRMAAPAAHYAIGCALSRLREEGVLLLGSGNIVHNLAAMDWRRRDSEYPWARRFEDHVIQAIRTGEHEGLWEYPRLGQDAALAVPTPDHYLPLLYVMGAARGDDAVRLLTPHIEYGSLSMTSVLVGGPLEAGT